MAFRRWEGTVSIAATARESASEKATANMLSSRALIKGLHFSQSNRRWVCRKTGCPGKYGGASLLRTSAALSLTSSESSLSKSLCLVSNTCAAHCPGVTTSISSPRGNNSKDKSTSRSQHGWHCGNHLSLTAQREARPCPAAFARRLCGTTRPFTVP
eukprot:3966345-Pyramimonas_sp.AAC.1